MKKKALLIIRCDFELTAFLTTLENMLPRCPVQ